MDNINNEKESLKNTKHIDRIFIFAFCILLIGAGLISSSPIVETDTFWHLAHGRFILKEHKLPNPDPFTYTARYWQDVDHEWLSQVILAAIDNISGLKGLRVTRALLVVATLVLGFITFHKLTKRYDLAFIASALWWVLMQPNVSIRPHLFGWVFSVLIIGLLLPNASTWKVRHYIVLFIISVIWVNMHPSVMIIPVFILIYILAAIGWMHISRKKELNFLKPFIIATCISSIACFIQPAGIRLFPFVMTPGIVVGINNEWLPFVASDVWNQRPFLLITFFITILWTLISIFFLRKRSFMIFPGLAVAFFAIFMAIMARRMTFFIFIPLMFSAYATSQWLEKKQFKKLDPFFAVIMCSVLLLSVFLITKRPNVPLLMERDILPNRFPENACDFLEKVQLEGNMMNTTTWGGYLSYRLYPKYKIMCDGRWIIVGRELVMDNIHVFTRQGNVENIFDKYKIDYLIEPIIDYAKNAPLNPNNWLLAYNDRATVILLRKGPKLLENLTRLCSFYKNNPDYLQYLEWQIYYEKINQPITPISILSIRNFCK